MEGIAGPPVERPRVPRERVSAQELARRLAALKDLKTWRTEQAALLSLDPALIWPMVSLERLARDPMALDDEVHAQEVRNWQRARIAPLLRAKLGALATN